MDQQATSVAESIDVIWLSGMDCEACHVLENDSRISLLFLTMGLCGAP